MMPSPVNESEEKFRYLSALATHQDVVNLPELFFSTLKILHSTLGTKLMVPMIGRKELNLHVLYVEVTRRGGYDKVVNEKRWREISELFNFSPTTTSASYVLKKHYFTLLYHYEQVYFFKSKSSIIAPISSGSSPLRIPAAIGTIDAKFDCGYLVTVTLGSEQLCGVIYHPNEQPTPPLAPADDEALSMAIVPYEPNATRPPEKRRKRKRRRSWGRDPNHPKPNRSGYNFFFAEKHSALKSLHPTREREFTKMIGEAWNSLNSEEKMVYQNIGLRDKERYRRELKEYHEKLVANAQRHEQV